MSKVLTVKGDEPTLIKQIMLRKGISMDELCRRTGKSKTTVSIKLNGNMTLKTLAEFAEALEVEVADLFPIPDGYVHWSQKIGEREKPVATASAVFCPKCGCHFTIHTDEEG